MTKTQIRALSTLSDHNFHFTLTNKKECVVYTSDNGNGSSYDECQAIKAYMESMNWYLFDKEFDRVCGKERQVFKMRKGE